MVLNDVFGYSKIGDILLIKSGERLAADVLLLEMSCSSGVLNEISSQGISTQR